MARARSGTAIGDARSRVPEPTGRQASGVRSTRRCPRRPVSGRDRLADPLRPPGLADGVGQRFQIVGAGAASASILVRPDDLPALAARSAPGRAPSTGHRNAVRRRWPTVRPPRSNPHRRTSVSRRQGSYTRSVNIVAVWPLRHDNAPRPGRRRRRAGPVTASDRCQSPVAPSRGAGRRRALDWPGHGRSRTRSRAAPPRVRRRSHRPGRPDRSCPAGPAHRRPTRSSPAATGAAGGCAPRCCRPTSRRPGPGRSASTRRCWKRSPTWRSAGRAGWRRSSSRSTRCRRSPRDGPVRPVRRGGAGRRGAADQVHAAGHRLPWPADQGPDRRLPAAAGGALERRRRPGRPGRRGAGRAGQRGAGRGGRRRPGPVV